MTNDLFYERSYRLKDNTDKWTNIFNLWDSVLFSEKKMQPFLTLENALVRIFQNTGVHFIGFVLVTISIHLHTCFKQNPNPKYLTKKFNVSRKELLKQIIILSEPILELKTVKISWQVISSWPTTEVILQFRFLYVTVLKSLTFHKWNVQRKRKATTTLPDFAKVFKLRNMIHLCWHKLMGRHLEV